MPQVLILHWDRRQLSGLLAETGGAHPQIRQVLTLPWSDASDPLQSPLKSAELLKSRLATLGVVPQQVMVCLSREEVILRHLDVPDVPDEELPALVAFQAASRSTLPMEQLLLDFLPLPKQSDHAGRPVLAVTVPKSLVQGITSLLQSAGLDTASVTFSSMGLAEFVAQTEQQRGHDPRQAVLAILRDGARVEMVILAQRQVLFAHSARLSTDENASTANLLMEVSRTIVAAQRLHPRLAIHHAWVIGSGPMTPDFMTQLSTRLGVTTDVLEPAGVGWAELPAGNLADHAGWLAAVMGLTLTESTRLIATFDFLHPRQPPKKVDLRKQWIMVGSAAALVIAALSMGLLHRTTASLERQIDALRTREKELDLTIEPGQGTLVAAKLVDDWQAGNLNQLQHLSTLEDLMEGTEQLYLSQYTYTAGTGDAAGSLQSFGNAKSREDIQQFYQRLSDTKTYRIQPRGLTQSSRDDEYPHRFELNAELLPKPKPTVNPKE